MIYRTKKITVRLTDKEYAKLREMRNIRLKNGACHPEAACRLRDSPAP